MVSYFKYVLNDEDTAVNNYCYSITIIHIVASYLLIVKSVGLFLKINTETCPKKENNSVQYSSPVVQSSEWIHPNFPALKVYMSV